MAARKQNKSQSQLVVANTHAVVDDDGSERRLVKGHTVLRADDPVVKRHGQLFEPVEPRAGDPEP
jgi:hypothetical protein